jgi:hypothetical protein
MTTDELTHKKRRFDDAVFSAINLEHKRLTVERELLDIKWFGYRFLSPLAATKLFYDTYRKLRVDFVREHKDCELADRLPIVSFENYAKNPKNLAMAWSARQAADTFCVPYEVYIEFGMRFWSRRSGGGRSYTPQINQLNFGNASEDLWRSELHKHIQEGAWLAARSLSEVPQLHPSAFRGTAEQVATRSHILALCNQELASWPRAIEVWCYTYPVLTPECFEPIVPPEVLSNAIETLSLLPRDLSVQPDPIPPSALWPSCHGMPDSMEASSDTCAKCSFAKTCGSLASMVKREVLRLTGYEEPRKVALRAAKNARQRRSTAKKRAARARGVPSLSSSTLPFPDVTLS